MEQGLITGSSDPYDGGKYLEDAALYRAALPQPYRMIDNLLSLFIDEVWNLISSRELHRDNEATRYKPQNLQSYTQVQLSNISSCITISPDENLIIVGHNSGISVLEQASLATVAEWSHSDANITSITVTNLPDGFFLLTTTSDAGIVRLFYVNSVVIFLMATFSHAIKPGESNCQKICTSTSNLSEFLTVYPSGADNKLEVYELPLALWMKEIDGALQQKHTEVIEHDESSRDSAKDFTFSKPVLLRTIDPPSDPTVFSSSHPAGKGQIFQDRISVGSTSSAVMSQQYLDSRYKSFEKKNKPAVVPEKLFKKEKGALRVPMINFLISPEKTCYSEENDRPTSADAVKWLIVSWSNTNYIQIYSLMKSSSKTPDLRSLYDWPLSCSVTASAFSQCCLSAAFALSNGNVITWSYLSGKRSVIHVTGASEIVQLEYIRKCCCSGICYCELPRCGHSSYLLALCSNGRIFQIDIGSVPSQSTVCDITPEIRDSCEIPIYIQILLSYPSICIIRQKNGRIYLYDLLFKRYLCEFGLSGSHLYTSDCLSFASKSKQMYIIGNNIEVWKAFEEKKRQKEVNYSINEEPAGNENQAFSEEETMKNTKEGRKSKSKGSATKRSSEGNHSESDNGVKIEEEKTDAKVDEEDEQEGIEEADNKVSYEETIDKHNTALIDEVFSSMASLAENPVPSLVFSYSACDFVGEPSVHAAPDEYSVTTYQYTLDNLVNSALRNRINGQDERRKRLQNSWFKMTEYFSAS